MALVFPRDFPAHLFRDVSFDVKRFVFANSLHGGQTQVREAAEPRWMLSVSTVELNREMAQPWTSWAASMRGGMKTFHAYHPEKQYPLNYRTGWGGLTVGGSPFNGTGDVTALTASTVALALLPANFALRAGDMIGLVEGANRGLYEIVEDMTASGAGVGTVTVEPNILTSIFTAAAVAYFYRPTCIMNLIADSFAAPRSSRPQPVSFSAMQKLV